MFYQTASKAPTVGDLLEVQKILGHHSILTTARYTHLTDDTNQNASQLINALMNGFAIDWGKVR